MNTENEEEEKAKKTSCISMWFIGKQLIWMESIKWQQIRNKIKKLSPKQRSPGGGGRETTSEIDL